MFSKTCNTFFGCCRKFFTCDGRLDYEWNFLLKQVPGEGGGELAILHVDTVYKNIIDCKPFTTINRTSCTIMLLKQVIAKLKSYSLPLKKPNAPPKISLQSASWTSNGQNKPALGNCCV